MAHTIIIRRVPREVAQITLVRRAPAVPEKYPLLHLALLQRVCEAELVVLVEMVREVQQLRGGLEHGEGRAARVVDDNGDTPVGVKPEEPLLLLLVRADVDDGGGERRAVPGFELLKENLRCLAVGGALRDQVQPGC